MHSSFEIIEEERDPLQGYQRRATEHCRGYSLAVVRPTGAERSRSLWGCSPRAWVAYCDL